MIVAIFALSCFLVDIALLSLCGNIKKPKQGALPVVPAGLSVRGRDGFNSFIYTNVQQEKVLPPSLPDTVKNLTTSRTTTTFLVVFNDIFKMRSIFDHFDEKLANALMQTLPTKFPT